jgi:hypothetical protein
MKATLIWTINDFLVYKMVSSYNTHGELACSYCIENNKVFTLTNDGKTSFFIVIKGFSQPISEGNILDKNQIQTCT